MARNWLPLLSAMLALPAASAQGVACHGGTWSDPAGDASIDPLPGTVGGLPADLVGLGIVNYGGSLQVAWSVADLEAIRSFGPLGAPTDPESVRLSFTLTLNATTGRHVAMAFYSYGGMPATMAWHGQLILPNNQLANISVRPDWQADTVSISVPGHYLGMALDQSVTVAAGVADAQLHVGPRLAAHDRVEPVGTCLVLEDPRADQLRMAENPADQEAVPAVPLAGWVLLLLAAASSARRRPRPQAKQ